MLPSQRNRLMEEAKAEGFFFIAKVKSAWHLSRTENGRPITLVLRNTPEGFYVEPPKYMFISRTSHFDFHEKEQRYTRNKNTLFSCIDKLRKSGLWDYIENQVFFKPNQENQKLEKDTNQQYKVTRQYYNILNRGTKWS